MTVYLYRFLKSRPNSEEFLESLLHFQHFRQFINSKIEKLKTKNQERDRFDDEVMMYEEGRLNVHCTLCVLIIHTRIVYM